MEEVELMVEKHKFHNGDVSTVKTFFRHFWKIRIPKQRTRSMENLEQKIKPKDMEEYGLEFSDWSMKYFFSGISD